MKKFFFLFLISLLAFPAQVKASEAVEVRAVWLTTNWNLDWPLAHHSIDQQKKHFTAILDSLQQLKINTLFFQSRIRGDVFYNSKIEPRSSYAKPGFDYLAFAIDECHKRGIECHAWMVMFPVGTKKHNDKLGKNSVVTRHKESVKYFNGEWYLDPGNPSTKNYLLGVIDEVVRNYDVDGIHFDYIRYPENATKFPDKDTFKKYGKGKSLEDWRRNNISALVAIIYDSIKAQKPWVQISSSPIGKYKDLKGAGSSWTAYSSVFQDAGGWIEAGKHDALYPMMYYENSDFFPYLDDWQKHTTDRILVPGIGLYKLLPNEKDMPLSEILNQIDYSRKIDVSGQAYFRVGNILSNTKGVKDELKNKYPYPAKLPPMKWLDFVAPNSPIDLQVYRNEQGKLCMRWNPYNDAEVQTYTIYCSTEDFIDADEPQNILLTGIRDNYIELDMEEGEFGLYYSVSASDRFHNESVPCVPAYFVHSAYAK